MKILLNRVRPEDTSTNLSSDSRSRLSFPCLSTLSSLGCCSAFLTTLTPEKEPLIETTLGKYIFIDSFQQYMGWRLHSENTDETKCKFKFTAISFLTQKVTFTSNLFQEANICR